MTAISEPSRTRRPLDGVGDSLELFGLDRLVDRGALDRMPKTVKVLLENLLRRAESSPEAAAAAVALSRWPARAEIPIPFMPSRILMQDFTGVPAMVDLAAMRSAAARAGADPAGVRPVVPVDLVIDHSVQVDAFARAAAYRINVEWEYRRNGERYAFLRWAQGAFEGLRVVPPGMGICHQVNLEHLAQVVTVRDGVAFPDTLVGTDSHTTMVNGLGVLGWGVGGIEAEGCMLGQPLSLPWPSVVGVRVRGALPAGATATDLVLTLTEQLRGHGVVGRFVEFFGPGLASLTVEDRATLSNMCPEYGATSALFPVDGETIRYLERTGRGARVDLVERYTREQGLFVSEGDPDPEFDEVVDLDLSVIEPSVAGPRRPQDRVPLPRVWESFAGAFGDRFGVGAPPGRDSLGNGSVAIAAITSCTNTSNPSVMLAAGLVAKRAVEAGLEVKPWVKTSLAPGSRVVTDYLQRAGLQPYLDRLGFDLVGYGCTTCIGNAGPLPDEVAREVVTRDLTVVAVLSGNRNFEGRIHPQVRASYLASPPLVVAYALAGTVGIDLEAEPLGTTPGGEPVFLRDLWPSPEEIHALAIATVDPELFRVDYAHIFEGDERWAELPASGGTMYDWDPGSTYIREPPFFEGAEHEPEPPANIVGARVLVMLGDSVTTDHISPAGPIAPDSPAGAWLLEHGVHAAGFNTYGSRRGNHEVMVRGTFANVRLRNLLAPETEGPRTAHWPDGAAMPIHETAMRYAEEGVPLLVIAGKEYGSGSSRDWAAKGPALLGVRAVLAESFERIHRSNLIGMGVLPLQFPPGETASSLGLSGREAFTIRLPANGPGIRFEVAVEARGEDGELLSFPATARIDDALEARYWSRGGILRTILRDMLHPA